MFNKNIIKCMVVDDEYPATTLLNAYINKHPSLTLVASTTSAPAALLTLQEDTVELLFLDIQMPHLNGIEILKTIAGKNIKVILTTAFREYALEGYEYNVADYLLKPITFERFEVAVEKALERINGQAQEYRGEIFVKAGYKLLKINFSDILFIESLGDYIAFHTTNGKIMSLDSLKQLQEKLPVEYFIRIHRSYIVSKKYVSGMSKANILVGNTKLPVGATFRKTISDAF